MPSELNGRSLRKKERRIYVDNVDDDEIEGRRNFNIEEKITCTRYNESFVRELEGKDVTYEYFQKNGFQFPMVIKEKTGLGLRVPSQNFKVSDVKQCVGSRRMLDVMDVTTQKALEMSMKEWTRYFENVEQRDRLLNVISLEFSHTKLDHYVDAPSIVHKLDWVETAWPRHLIEEQTESTNIIEKMKYPKVQKYVLMSVAGCYTDFHIDFGGTSVWYHILHGKKIFWLIPPTERNLALYEDWIMSGKQADHFLGDQVDACQRVELEEGYTFFIPTGWIHAVYTPKDSLVFGGNFLHVFNIPMQLKISEIEDKTRVPLKFRFPFYMEIHWYVLERYCHTLSGHSYLAESDSVGVSKSLSSTLIDVKEAEPNEKSARSPRVVVRSTPTKQEPRGAQSNSPSGSGGGSDSEISPNHKRMIKPISIKLNNCGRYQSSTSPDGGGGTIGRSHVLTRYEYDGLELLTRWLGEMLPAKRSAPPDISRPERLLQHMQELLEDHKTHDVSEAVTGETILNWPAKKVRRALGVTTTTTGRRGRGRGGGSGVKRERVDNPNRRRRVRCRQCEPCTRSECGVCTFCLDMPRFGGPGRMKQTCYSRKCMNPVLPRGSFCLVCGKAELDEQNTFDSLLECVICLDITHEPCFKRKFPQITEEGVVNEDVVSGWECPRCLSLGKGGTNNRTIPKIFQTHSQDFQQKPSLVKTERATSPPTELTNDRTEPTNDHTELTNDRTHLTNDRTELKNERTELTNDRAEPTNDRTEPTNDHIELTNDRTHLTNDRTELKNDRAELKNDRTEPTNDRTEPTNDRKSDRNLFSSASLFLSTDYRSVKSVDNAPPEASNIKTGDAGRPAEDPEAKYSATLAAGRSPSNESSNQKLSIKTIIRIKRQRSAEQRKDALKTSVRPKRTRRRPISDESDLSDSESPASSPDRSATLPSVGQSPSRYTDSPNRVTSRGREVVMPSRYL